DQVLAQIHLYAERFADLPAAERVARIRVTVLPKTLDEEVARYMVEGFGGVITRLTPAQANYLGVPAEGPFKSDEYRY
ncbi:MAG: S-adenosyl-L-homocysteine hydrolase, partial [Acidithiobacillus ferrivorans]